MGLLCSGFLSRRRQRYGSVVYQGSYYDAYCRSEPRLGKSVTDTNYTILDKRSFYDKYLTRRNCSIVGLKDK